MDKDSDLDGLAVNGVGDGVRVAHAYAREADLATANLMHLKAEQAKGRQS